MFKLCVIAAILAVAVAIPTADPKPEPKPEPKPGLIATTYTAPIIPGAPMTYNIPLPYNGYFAPMVYNGYNYNYNGYPLVNPLVI